MQEMREIPAIVTEKIVIKISNFHTFGGGTSLVMSLANRRTDLHVLNNFSSSIDKASFKKNSMSLGLVVLEEKLFTRTPQSDDIKMSFVNFQKPKKTQCKNHT